MASEGDPGFVYLAYNPDIPHLVKIGFSTRGPYERIKESWTEFVPGEYHVIGCWHVENVRQAEGFIFRLLRSVRLYEDQEIFKLTYDIDIQTKTGPWCCKFARLQAYKYSPMYQGEDRDKDKDTEYARERCLLFFVILIKLLLYDAGYLFHFEHVAETALINLGMLAEDMSSSGQIEVGRGRFNYFSSIEDLPEIVLCDRSDN